jgi:two-component system phosphate regulon sensor histidine kinase PhoR
MRRNRWPWAVLFVVVVLVIAMLATSWNLVLVENYRTMIDVAREKWANKEEASPWLGIVLGSLGFGILIFVFSIFFAKLLREMKLNQAQKDFLANITHELKTPLASLELSSNLLRNPQNLSPQEMTELWENHDMELRRLRDEIERLLTSSKWEQFQEKPHLQSLPLYSWLEDTLKKWSRKLPKDAKLQILGSAVNLQVEADPALLDLITSNIFDNALKFCGNKPPSIEVSLEVIEDIWRLHIRDQGIGFETDKSELLFKRFKRLKHLTRTAIPGSGLGLHLASTAAKAMDMKLMAFSEGPNRGACFTLQGKIS